MNTFFCADESRKKGEDLCGTAGSFTSYALIECPTPWAGDAFASPAIPSSLKAAFTEIARAKVSIRPLLIAGPPTAGPPRTKVIVYRTREGLAKGFVGLEQDLPSLDGVASLARGYVSGTPGGLGAARATRDLLVCTHASNDKCCGAFGLPFHEEVIATVASLGLANVRVWQCSHLGGHRFAPTMIDFPEGRYYGRLDGKSLSSILTRTGDIGLFDRVYRGSARLPGPLQLLEREMILRVGWAFLDHAVTGKVLSQDRARRETEVELSFRRPDGSTGRAVATIAIDEKKSVTLVGDCHGDNPAGPVARVEKYGVKALQLHEG